MINFFSLYTLCIGVFVMLFSSADAQVNPCPEGQGMINGGCVYILNKDPSKKGASYGGPSLPYQQDFEKDKNLIETLSQLKPYLQTSFYKQRAWRYMLYGLTLNIPPKKAAHFVNKKFKNREISPEEGIDYLAELRSDHNDMALSPFAFLNYISLSVDSAYHMIHPVIGRPAETQGQLLWRIGAELSSQDGK